MSAQFLALKQRYVSTFPQKQQDLQNAWAEKDINSLRALLHKLAGSSGSYGFEHVNQLCHQTMDLLENYNSNNDANIDGFMSKLFDFLTKQQ